MFIEAAKGNRGFVEYDEIKAITGNLHLFGGAWSGHLGRILYDVIQVDREDDPNRPLLSAVAVGASGMPGPGLFVLAREIGELTGTSEKAELTFWSNTVKALQDYWRDCQNPYE